MGRRSNTIPKLCTDKNGRAFTKVRGRFISLGRAGTPESHQRYSEVLTALRFRRPVTEFGGLLRKRPEK